MPKLRKLISLATQLILSATLQAQTTPAAVGTDPAADKANPASIETFRPPACA
jgi:hypothetical protein